MTMLINANEILPNGVVLVRDENGKIVGSAKVVAPSAPTPAGVSRDDLAEIISKAGAPPGPPDGPIGALPDGNFLKVQAYKQADAVIARLAPAGVREITDDEVERAMRAFYHDSAVLNPTTDDDRDDLRRWTNDMRAALAAAKGTGE